MALPEQTVALLNSARLLSAELDTDAVLLLTETSLDWDEVREMLGKRRLLVAAHNRELADELNGRKDVTVLELEAEPVPTQERLSLALLKAIANEQLHPGSHVVVLYNGVAFEYGKPEPI